MKHLRQLIQLALSKLSTVEDSEFKTDLIQLYDTMYDVVDKLEQQQKQLDYQEEMLDRHINQLEEVKHAWENRVKVLMN